MPAPASFDTLIASLDLFALRMSPTHAPGSGLAWRRGLALCFNTSASFSLNGSASRCIDWVRLSLSRLSVLYVPHSNIILILFIAARGRSHKYSLSSVILSISLWTVVASSSRIRFIVYAHTLIVVSCSHIAHTQFSTLLLMLFQ